MSDDPGIFMKKIWVILFGYLILSALSVNAQKLIVRGNVTDKTDGEPIIGVNVYEQDEQQRIITGTITNYNGDYQIQVTGNNSKIKFTFIGYKPEEISVNSRTVIDVAMSPEIVELSSVSITAERRSMDPLTNISERDRTGSSVKLEMTQMIESGITSAEDALQGQLSGVDIITSGDPGSGSSIVIRGLSTLGNANPLIVVDGIPQDVKPSEGFDFSSADVEDISDLVNIAPQDIRSIEVLKDAASTAVWGTKGANGVLLIETHRGKLGKTKFTYQSKLTLTVPIEPIPMLNGDEYIMMQLEELHAPKGIFSLPPELSNDPLLLGKDYYNYTQNTDWIGAVTQNGFAQDHYFKMIGGGERTSFFTSLGYYDESGTTINTGLRRLTTRINLDYKVSRKLMFQTNFTYTNSLVEDNYEYKGYNVREMAYMKAPNMSIMEFDSDGNPTLEYFTPVTSYQGSGTTYYNPVAMGKESTNDLLQDMVQTSFALDYKIATWLTFKETISYTYLNSKRNRFLPYTAIGADWLNSDNNYAYEANESVNNLLTRSQVFLSPKLNEKHTLSGVLMWETSAVNNEYVSLANSKTASLLMEDPAIAGPYRSSNSGSSVQRGLSGMGQIFYKLLDRYMVTANIRADGNSKFGADSRWGYFPSISLGWRFSGEPWIAALKIFDDSRLRLSYGITGNDMGSSLKPYNRHAIYGTVSGVPNQYINNSLIVPIQVQLDQLKWETLAQWNAGLDVGLVNRVYLTIEAYKKITTDILWQNYKIPSSSGNTSLLWYNGGKLENRGWDLMINVWPVRSENWLIKLDFNINHNSNRFLEFPDNFNNEVSTSLGNEEYPRRAEIGDPIGSFYGLRYLGVWPDDESVKAYNPDGEVIKDLAGNDLPLIYQNGYQFQGGDARYQDINHDGVIDILDAVYLGDSNPDFEGGIGVMISYKSMLVLSTSFHSRIGYDIVNMVAAETQGMSDRNNQSSAVLRRWRKPGDNYPNILPRAYMGHPANNLGSDRYVEDGSFLRLINLMIKYSLPKDFSKKLRIDNMEIALTMRKLFTWTKYTGQDPEISRGYDPFWIGVDQGETPPPRRFTLSILIDF